MMDVLGVEAVLANLEAFNVRTQRKAKDVTKSAAEKALSVANELTPVSKTGSHGNEPGFLKAGNAIREGTGEGGSVYVGAAVSSGSASWELYNPVFYAGYVILGTRYMAARDFFTPALAAGKAAMYEGIARLAL